MPSFRQKFAHVNQKLAANIGDAASWLRVDEDTGEVVETVAVQGLYSEKWIGPTTAGYQPDLAQPMFRGLASEMGLAAKGDFLRFEGVEYVMQSPQADGEGQLFIPLRRLREVAND